MKQKLVFIIPRGEVIRNFAYTGILERLKEFYELHIIAIVPNEDIKQYLMNIGDNFVELDDEPAPYWTNLLHEILNLAHNKYLWSEAAKVRWNMRNVEAKSVKDKLFRVFKKTMGRLSANNFSMKLMEKLDLWMAKSNPKVTKYREVLRKIKPDLVFNGSHIHGRMAYPAVQAARLEGVKTGAFLFSWDNLTSQGRVIPPYDHYMAWNENIKKDLKGIYPYIPSEKIHVTGTPQFTFHFNPKFHLSREEFLAQLGLQPHEKFILYSSGMSNHMPYEPEVAELLADILPSIDPDLKLVIRTYAKDYDDVFKELEERRKDIIIPKVKWVRYHLTPLEEDQYFFTNLLRHCELGVNVASTISLELCMLDKPAVNIGFNPPNRDIYPYDYTRFYSFDHYKPIVESGAVSVAPNPEELKNIIEKYLENPSWKAKERKALIDKFFEGNLDEKVIDIILEEFQKIQPSQPTTSKVQPSI